MAESGGVSGILGAEPEGSVEGSAPETALDPTAAALAAEAAKFDLPAGLFIDRDSNVYVVDSYNRRVQVFHYSGKAAEAAGK